jgi:flagellar biogenesis protein FliO
VEAKAEAPAPAKVEAKALAEAPVEAKAAPLAAVEAPKAATPVTGGDGPLTVTPEKAEDRPLADPQEAAPAEGPGLGAVLVSLLLVGGAGFVMWRKARGAKKAGAANQKLIRPLGAHLLGPKHGLLLVDVAGEMVLLSTSEKGVQMLTKIETPAALEAAKAAVAAAPVAAEPTPTPPGTLADRLGRALSKVRAAAQSDEDVSVDELERGFFARADDAVREAAEDDALAALAAQVDDEPEIGAAPRRVGRTPAAGRGRPAAVRPLATPIPVAAPSPAARNPAREQHLAADILEKIRQLQGA